MRSRAHSATARPPPPASCISQLNGRARATSSQSAQIAAQRIGAASVFHMLFPFGFDEVVEFLADHRAHDREQDRPSAVGVLPDVIDSGRRGRGLHDRAGLISRQVPFRLSPLAPTVRGANRHVACKGVSRCPRQGKNGASFPIATEDFHVRHRHLEDDAQRAGSEEPRTWRMEDRTWCWRCWRRPFGRAPTQRWPWRGQTRQAGLESSPDDMRPKRELWRDICSGKKRVRLRAPPPLSIRAARRLDELA